MSFAAQTKKELTQLTADVCCQRNELEAVLAQNAAVQRTDGRRILTVETENVSTARRIYTHFKEGFHLKPVVAVRKKMRLKKNNVYAIHISAVEAEQLLAALGWKLPEQGNLAPVLHKRMRNCCRKSYLRGAFLAGGSVNAPGSPSYHLEIAVTDATLAAHIQSLMNEFALNARIITRKRVHVVYLKEGEKIVEFLNVIGAHQALLKFEDTRILKGMRNQVNRLVNCETANLNKTIAAAVRQVEVIRYLDDHVGLFKLPDHLREVAELRLRFPEVNLQELAMHLNQKVSKSGLNHRFRKLEEIAERLRVEGHV